MREPPTSPPPRVTGRPAATCSAAQDGYIALWRFVVRVQRATLALSSLWISLNNSSSGGAAAAASLANAQAWHVLRIHVHELRFFVSGLTAHFIAHVCEGCWSELRAAVDAASSPTELRRAHDAYLDTSMRHCLLHPEGAAAASLLNGVLALALTLHRELCHELDAPRQRERGAAAHASGASWAALVDASRRQFAMLMDGLRAQPLAPRALVHDGVWALA